LGIALAAWFVVRKPGIVRPGAPDRNNVKHEPRYATPARDTGNVICILQIVRLSRV